MNLACRVTFAGLTLLGGCATPPAVDADIAAAARGLNSPDRPVLLARQTERIAGRGFTTGNRVELLRDGPATYAAMAKAIASAKQRIDMESYTFDSEEGGRFAALLMAKSTAGVEVHLVFDAYGSRDTPDRLFNTLRAAGVSVLEYNPIRPNDRVPLTINQRDHRKLLVVDGRVAITGGVNISKVYLNPNVASGPETLKNSDADDLPWRDTDMRIEGSVVAQFEQLFNDTWQEQHGPALPPPPISRSTGGHARILALDGAPDDKRPAIYRTLIVALKLARHSAHLTTGYFAPPPDLRHALREAARRGVDVQLVVPAKSDSDLALAAGRAAFGDLLEDGVVIHERQGVVLHAKTTVIDGVYSIIGSSNLDWRSVVYNNEIDAVVIDVEFGRQMEAMFAEDVAASLRIDLAAWQARPFSERLTEWRARLIEPLL